jgi:uncharacterized protein DUF11
VPEASRRHPAATPPAADLAIHLTAVGTVLLPGATYKVSVTNNGPDVLGSAAVVVQLDHRVSMANPSPCSVDLTAATLTCTFSELAAGATATRNTVVWFAGIRTPANVDATARRVASSPSDPNSANDSESRNCYWDSYVGVGIPPGQMHCQVRRGISVFE